MVAFTSLNCDINLKVARDLFDLERKEKKRNSTQNQGFHIFDINSCNR